MANDEEKPIRVVDRRMFTPEGELRPDFEAEDSAEPSPAAYTSPLPRSLPEVLPPGRPALQAGSPRPNRGSRGAISRRSFDRSRRRLTRPWDCFRMPPEAGGEMSASPAR